MTLNHGPEVRASVVRIPAQPQPKRPQRVGVVAVKKPARRSIQQLTAGPAPHVLGDRSDPVFALAHVDEDAQSQSDERPSRRNEPLQRCN